MQKVVLGLAAAASAVVVAGEAPDPARSAELVRLVRQECGFCHGLYLTGGLGPSLKPAALEGKDREYLVAIILHGRRGSAMPPWRDFLSEAEARWIAEQLKRGLPK